jgi:FKBP-type peptidyl-prolyl cis-trans isomerase FklB
MANFFAKDKAMKKPIIILALAAMFAAPAYAEEASPFKDKRAQDSYAIGAQTGRNLKKESFELNVDMLIQGLKDGISGDKLLMSDKELRAVMTHVQSEVHNTMVAARRTAGLRNKEESIKFLAENGKKDGVVTTASGLQYKIIKAGSGVKPTAGDTVALNYRGTLLDGTEFDASPDGKPSEMVVVQTVPGFKEALKLMPVGSKWQIAVPWNLGYGERGIGTQIGPYQSLLFDVELVAITKEGGPDKAGPAKK